jgi:histone deacetylase complex regulatory component SIN3
LPYLDFVCLYKQEFEDLQEKYRQQTRELKDIQLQKTKTADEFTDLNEKFVLFLSLSIMSLFNLFTFAQL